MCGGKKCGKKKMKMCSMLSRKQMWRHVGGSVLRICCDDGLICYFFIVQSALVVVVLQQQVLSWILGESECGEENGCAQWYKALKGRGCYKVGVRGV